MATRRSAAKSRERVAAEKEEKAIAFQNEVFRRSGRLPTFEQVAAHVHVNRTKCVRWRRFIVARRDIEANGAPKNRRSHSTDTENKAIEFQTEVFQESGRLPTLKRVAVHVHARPTTLRHWRRFMAARHGLEAQGVPKNHGGPRPTGKQDKAIAFQDEVFRQSGRLPTFEQIAAHVHVRQPGLARWSRFMAARRALEAKGAPKNRRAFPTEKESKAIAHQDEVFRKSGRLPTIRQIAGHLRVRPKTLCNWPRFMEARRKIAENAGLVAKTTAWGEPDDFREAEAVSQLEAMFNATGHVPPVGDFAHSLGVGKQVFNAWPVFRLAYRSLWKQQRPGGTAARHDLEANTVPGNTYFMVGIPAAGALCWNLSKSGARDARPKRPWNASLRL